MFAQLIMQNTGNGWDAIVSLPSLHPGAAMRGAILSLATAMRIADRREVQIKAIGTGKHLLDDC